MFTSEEDIRERLKRRQVVVVVGAGATMAATNRAATASWFGLLEDGIRHARDFGQPKLTDEAANRYLEILATGDLDSWLAIATLIETKLEAPNGREWARWVQDATGRFHVSNSRLLSAIHDLGVPITTTNYDDLLERTSPISGIPSLTWKETSSIVRVINGDENGVIHFHGYYKSPESVILGVQSYERVLSSEAAQSLQRAIGQFNSLLFIGYGAGVTDPNFEPLVRFLSGPGAGHHRHYILVSTSEFDKGNMPPGLFPISYGTDYDELPTFLRQMRGSQPSSILAVGKTARLILPGSRFADDHFLPELCVVPAGNYQVGDSAKTERGARASGSVPIPQPYAIGRYPVTVEEWSAFVEDRGYRFKKRTPTEDRMSPIVFVNFDEANSYIEWLSDTTSFGYRLPSELEWEVACRGLNSEWWLAESLQPYGNFAEACLGKVMRVDTFPPNDLGLADTLGNVWEWTSDAWEDDRLSYDATSERLKARVDNKRVLKGGCYYYDKSWAIPAAAIGFGADLAFNSVGFRVARDILAAIEPGKIYAIASGLARTVLSAGDENVEHSDLLFAEAWGNLARQLWRVEQVSPDAFRIISAASGRAIIVSSSGEIGNFTRVQLGDPADGVAEWRLTSSGRGFLLQLSGVDLALDLEDADTSARRQLITFVAHGNLNQIWHFIEIE